MAFLGVLLVVAAVGPGEPTLGDLHKAIGEGRWSLVAKLARELEAAAAARAPLELWDGQALASAPRGLGMYEPLSESATVGEELYLYSQVANHGQRSLAAGYELHLVSDLVVFDSSGAELARDSGFGESRFVSRVPQRDTFVVVAVRTKGLPAGRYVARLVVTDKVADKRASIDIPFRVAGPRR